MEKTVQCVVICLNRERQQCMERQIKNLGITFPVHYLEASVPENTGSYFPLNTSLRDKRVMCCARSHNRAIQYASQDSSPDFTVIIEDDVGIHKTDFIRTVKELASRWSEITAQGKHSVALGWVPEHNYETYSLHSNTYTKLRSTNPDILLFDMEQYKRHVSGTQAYMIEKTYAKQVSAVLMKDTFQEMYESIHRQKYRYLEITNNSLPIDYYIHHAFNALVAFPPLAIEFKIEEQVNPHNELKYWIPFFKGYEAKREEYWKPGGKIAWFTSGKDDYEQALLPQLDMEIIYVLPNTDASVYKDIHKVILGSHIPADPLTDKHIIRLITTNPLIDDIERYTNNLKCAMHTPKEIWLKGNLEQYTSYLETLYNVPVALIPALKPPRIPENPPYKAKAEETALDIVIMEKNTNFNTSGWKALAICEQLYLQDPERIHQVFFINTPKENPTSMGMIGSLKLKQDGKLRLFNAPTTAEIIQYFLTVSNNVVFLSNQIFDDMNYGYYAVVQTGFPLVHSSSELRTAGIGQYYDSNNMLEAVGHLREPFARKVSRVPKLVHQTWETKDLPPAMKANLDYNKAQNPDFKFILYDDQDRIRFLETHFDASVVKAYHTLVPGAYRADLFRYCVLYVLGGIYMDMRFQCAEGFHLTEIAEPQYIRDIAHWGKDAVYNGIIVSSSKNKTLFDCIIKIVKFCEECYYGPNPLCITGPVLLGNHVKEEVTPCIQMYVYETGGGITIKQKDRPLFYTYEQYNTDKSTIQPYWRTWDLREVFGEVNIGTSESDTKIIKLQKSYPDGWECDITKHGFPDRFETSINKDILTVKRMDSKAPWGWPHKGKIVLRSVPKLVHQTWETKDLPPAMKAAFEYNKAQNPEFQFILYDNQDRIAFIQKHFDISVLTAYHTLVPGAYRADLFRYCVLYVMGGIYMDIRFKCADGFRFADITEAQYVKDRTMWGSNVIYNGFMVSKASNKTLYNCIQEIVKNCEKSTYGQNPLCPTGPYLLGKYVKEELNPNITMKVSDTVDSIVTIKEDRVLLTTYKEYYDDRRTHLHYWETWEKRQIYGEVTIGTCESDTKIIKLHKSYPDGWECVVDAHGFPDRFETTVNKDILTVKRIDSKSAWGWPHMGRIVKSESFIHAHNTVVVTTTLPGNDISRKRKENLDAALRFPIVYMEGKRMYPIRSSLSLRLMEYFKTSKYEYGILCDDDFHPCPNFLEELSKTVKELPANWRSLHLCPGWMWGRKFRRATVAGKFDPEGDIHDLEAHSSDRFFMNCDPVLYENKSIWLGGPIAMLVNRSTIHSVIEDFNKFKDTECPNDIVLTKILTKNDYICKNPQLGYEKEQGGSTHTDQMSNLGKHIEKVVYINLDKRLDRKHQIEQELAKMGLSGERVSAIEHTRGIIGCGMSHIAVLKQAIANKYKNILVLEDDFQFIVDRATFEKELQSFFDLNIPYDVLMLSYNCLEKKPYNTIVSQAIDVLTTSGYIVHERFYDTLLRIWEEGLQKIIETGCKGYALDTYWRSLQPSSQWFLMNTRIGVQRESYSDIVYRNVNYNV